MIIKHKVREDERKLDKKRERQFENPLFFSLRQFNALQIKPICFNCLTKRLSKHTFILKK